jgi:hypothetical protein
MAKKMGGWFAAHCIWLLAQDYSLKIKQKQGILSGESPTYGAFQLSNIH